MNKIEIEKQLYEIVQWLTKGLELDKTEARTQGIAIDHQARAHKHWVLNENFDSRNEGIAQLREYAQDVEFVKIASIAQRNWEWPLIKGQTLVNDKSK